MNQETRRETQKTTWTESDGTIGKFFAYGKDVIKNLSNYHLVVRRPNAKLIDIPIHIPALFVLLGFVFLLWLAPELLAIGLAAALYFQLQISFQEITEHRSRDVDDVEYREVD